MLIVERQHRLLAILQQKKVAKLESLANQLQVSVSTIRRDLDLLENQGLVRRTHGGAIYQRGVSDSSAVKSGTALSFRINERVAEKKAIAKYAAQLVEPQMTVLLDGGSTIIYLAKQITARPIQVVTNSLAIASFFSDDEQVELFLIGGNLYPRTGVTIGPVATGCLADLHADLSFLSVAGIFGDAAFNVNMAMAEVEQAMMQQAAKCIMLMDSGKFDHKSLVRMCSLDEVDLIVTDSGISQVWRDQLKDRLAIAPVELASEM